MLKKDCLLLILLLSFIYNCKDQKEKNFVREKTTANSDTIITDIKKDCDINIEHNIYNYLLCQSWKNLNENDLKTILHYAKEENDAEVLNVIGKEVPSWIVADLKTNSKNYKLKVNGYSYIKLINALGSEKILTFDAENRSKVEKYFIRNLTEDDDENYNEKLKNIKPAIIDLKNWKGNFKFDNNNYDQLYKKYTLNITNNKITFYQGDLPACEISCIPYLYNNNLYLYFDSETTDCKEFSSDMINNLLDGDFMMKLYRKNGSYYITSPIIEVWDEKTSSFKINTPTKLNIEN